MLERIQLQIPHNRPKASCNKCNQLKIHHKQDQWLMDQELQQILIPIISRNLLFRTHLMMES